jgi:kynureninase
MRSTEPYTETDLMSSQYAFQSQIKRHGLDVEKTLIEMEPRAGEYTLREEDILETIEKQGSEIALVMFSGIQYWSGQCFPMKSVTKTAKDAVSRHPSILTSP